MRLAGLTQWLCSPEKAERGSYFIFTSAEAGVTYNLLILRVNSPLTHSWIEPPNGKQEDLCGRPDGLQQRRHK